MKNILKHSQTFSNILKHSKWVPQNVRVNTGQYCCVYMLQVSVRDGNVYVKADAESVAKTSRVKTMVKASADNNTTYVLVGGGKTRNY